MAKRIRGSSRPGHRKPLVRRPAASSGTVRPSVTATPASAPASPAPSPTRSAGLTDAEVQRAAELEAQLVAEEQAAEQARKRSQVRTTTAREGYAAARALDPEQEYAYVARDLKDIARIAILLLVVLFALYLLIDVTGAFKIT